jgi:hypothetical protein
MTAERQGPRHTRETPNRNTELGTGQAEEPVDRAGLDQTPPDGRPYTGADGDDRPLTVRVQVRIAVGGHAEAVAAAQGHALRALLTALTGDPPAPAGRHARPAAEADDERNKR